MSRIPFNPDNLSLSMEELEVDVSSFIHYLHSKSDSTELPERASFWCLIPHRLEFAFAADVEDYRLEKEVFSRTIWIVSKKVPDSEIAQRKAQLFSLFEDAITDNQIKAVSRLLKSLKPESRDKLRQSYSAHLQAEGAENAKK